ncbi:hypothetical protein [Mechercharimyces sp. CAU 1602]|uniref:hypothetical protein n=1 Tax=Mechercharimyces sp. CAU 1602 TaxID=2973933 RepID=UPI0021624DC2|nr:hypothetical protein [Mechercharimyces sp. CAU 1602]MCS1350359.1 hypothetical protein [Mechercharimyces sp. CAU 1602]
MVMQMDKYEKERLLRVLNEVSEEMKKELLELASENVTETLVKYHYELKGLRLVAKEAAEVVVNPHLPHDNLFDVLVLVGYLNEQGEFVSN